MPERRPRALPALTALLLTADAAAQQPGQMSQGDAAAVVVQEMNRAYAISAQALGACQQSKMELEKQIADLKAQLAKGKD